MTSANLNQAEHAKMFEREWALHRYDSLPATRTMFARSDWDYVASPVETVPPPVLEEPLVLVLVSSVAVVPPVTGACPPVPYAGVDPPVFAIVRPPVANPPVAMPYAPPE